MPQYKHQFESVYKNVEEISLARNSAAMINCYLTEAKTVKNFYGDELKINLDTGFGVDGVYWWNDKSIWIVVSGGRVFKVDLYDVRTELTGASMTKGYPVDFELTQETTGTGTQYLYMCNNSYIHYTDGGSSVTVVSSGGAPSTAISLSYLNGRLAAVDKSKFIKYSASNDYDSWTTGDNNSLSDQSTISAGCKGESGDILCISDRSYEKFYFSGSDNVIDRLQASFGRHGISAPKTLRYFNNAWHWLNHERVFVKLGGVELTAFGTPYDRIIQSIDTVDDAFSWDANIFGLKLYITSFPSAKKTIALDYMNNYHPFELGDYKNGDYDLWYGNCHAYSPLLNKHWIGSRSESKIYQLSTTKYNHAGLTTRPLLRLSHVDYGTISKTKNINKRTYKVKTGAVDMGDLTTEPVLMVRDSINNKWWEDLREIKLGKIGETDMFKEEVGSDINGEFISRQPEITLSDAVPMELCEIEDDYEIEL